MWCENATRMGRQLGYTVKWRDATAAQEIQFVDGIFIAVWCTEIVAIHEGSFCWKSRRFSLLVLRRILYGNFMLFLNSTIFSQLFVCLNTCWLDFSSIFTVFAWDQMKRWLIFYNRKSWHVLLYIIIHNMNMCMYIYIYIYIYIYMSAIYNIHIYIYIYIYIYIIIFICFIYLFSA